MKLELATETSNTVARSSMGPLPSSFLLEASISFEVERDDDEDGIYGMKGGKGRRG